MDNHLKDLLLLLRGNSNVEALCDTIVEMIEVNVELLPDVFHEVILEFLVNQSFSIRSNASYLISKLAVAFSHILIPLISDSDTDGELLNIADIDIETLMKCENLQLFHKQSSIYGFKQSSHNDNIYTQDWLPRQRKELKRCIGIESNLHEDILGYSDFDECVYDKDFLIEKVTVIPTSTAIISNEISLSTSTSESEYPYLSHKLDCILTRSLENNQPTEILTTKLFPVPPLSTVPTNETWLARLVRVMIAGLMSSQWETRHGYAMGLNQLINYLFANKTNINNITTIEIESKLPGFLTDDILSCGICVLVIDRFMDFDGDSCSESLSPVKESIGKLISTSLQCSLSDVKILQVWNIILKIISSKYHWTVNLGGLIALRYFVSTHFSIVDKDFEDLINILICITTNSFNRVEEEYFIVAIIKVLMMWTERVTEQLEQSSINSDFKKLCSKLSSISLILSSLYKIISRTTGFNKEIIDFSSFMVLSQLQSTLCTMLYHIIDNAIKKAVSLDNLLLELVGFIACLLNISNDLLIYAVLYYTPMRQVEFFICFSESMQIINKILKLVLVCNHNKATTILIIDNSSVTTFCTYCFRIFGTFLAATMIKTVDQMESELSNVENRQQSHSIIECVVARKRRNLWSEISMLIVETMYIGFKDLCNNRVVAQPDVYNMFCNLMEKLIKSVLLDCGTISDEFHNVENGLILFEHAMNAFDSLSKMQSSTQSIFLWFHDCDFQRERFIIVFTRILYVVDNLSVSDDSVFSDSSKSNYSCNNFQVSAHSLVHRILDSVFLVVCKNTISKYNDLLLEKSKIILNVPKKSVRIKIVPDYTLPKSILSTDKRKSCFDANNVNNNNNANNNTTVIMKVHNCHDRFSYTLESLGLFVFEIASVCNLSDCEVMFDTLDDIHKCIKDACTLLQKRNNEINVEVVVKFLKAILNRRREEALIDSLLTLSEESINVPYLCNYISSAVSIFVQKLYNSSFEISQVRLKHIIHNIMSLGRDCIAITNIAGSILYSLSKEIQGFIYDLIIATGTTSINMLVLPFITNALDDNNIREKIATDGILIKALLTPIIKPGMQLSDVSIDVYIDSAVESICGLFEIRSCIYRYKDVSNISVTDKNKLFKRNADELILKQIAQTISFLLFEKVKLLPDYIFNCSIERGYLSKLFFSLSQRLYENILICYDSWFSIALAGIADSDILVRQNCMEVFRLVIPIAPLAKQIIQKKTSGSHTNETVSESLLIHLFNKEKNVRLDQSTSSIDINVINKLSQMTNLVECSAATAEGNPTKCIRLSPARLRDYQWDGISWLTQLRRYGLNGILADEMGIGKSIQALAVLAILRLEKNFLTLPSLLVCPASLILHWEDEIIKYFPSELLQPCRVTKSTDFSIMDMGHIVFIMSYDMLRREINSNINRFTRQCWETIILDEAHLIKNPNTDTAKAIFSLHANHRMALTGTPIQNEVQDIWSLMNFLLPNYLGNYKEFNVQVIRPIHRSFIARRTLAEDYNLSKTSDSKALYNTIDISSNGLHLLRKLHKQILPFILRRTKSMVAHELPSKTEIDVICPLSIVQLELYQSYQRKFDLTDEDLENELRTITVLGDLDADDITSIEENNCQNDSGDNCQLAGWASNDITSKLVMINKESNKIHPLKALNYLKLLCVHPALVMSHKHVSYRNRLLDAFNSSGKLLRLTSLLMESGVISEKEFSLNYNLEDIMGELDQALSTSIRSCATLDCDSEFIDANSNDESEIVEEESIFTDVSHRKRKRGFIDSKTDPKNGMVHRCLIFCQHKSTLDLIESCVLKRYFPTVNYQRLDGTNAPHKRAYIAKKFNNQVNNKKFKYSDNNSTNIGFINAKNHELLHNEQISNLKNVFPTCSAIHKSRHNNSEVEVQYMQQTDDDIDKEDNTDIRILLMTTRSCGLGLNLTAADTVIFVEHDWNPFVDMQAMDRAHRIGQEQPVTVYRILAQSTIEARIIGLQGLKQNIANQVVNDDNSGGIAETASSKSFGTMLWDSLIIQQSESIEL